MKSRTLFHKRISGVIPFVVLFMAIVTLASTRAEAQDPFITTWKTDNSGASDPDQITIHTFPGETYSYDVDWGDGNSDTGVTGDITHTYSSAGTYTVEITGDFPRIYFWNDGDPSDAEKILTIEQWGDIAWSSMEFAFRDASNLVINSTAPDAPDLSGVTSTEQMFFGNTSLNSDLNHWDVSNVTNMRAMFQQASSFNQPLDNWDVSNVTDLVRMFTDASAFNQDIGGWDVSNVTDINGMFSASAFNQDISTWDVSNVMWMSSMFHGTPFNQDISGWDVSNVTDMYGMFNSTTAFNQDISGWDVSNVTDMEFMFRESSAFNQDISGWDVSNVTNMRGMFYDAGVFNQDIGAWNVSNVTDMEFMFFNASPFNQNIGGWDIGNVTTMDSMLSGSGLSTVNYDNTLTGWAGQTVQSGISLGASGLEYCAETARQTLTDPPNNWTITGDALASGCSSTGFITTWEVTAGDLDITIPTFPGESYSYDVDWGDGNSDAGVAGDITHTYSSAGTYTVEITGDFPRIYFNNTGDKEKIMTVEQWGDIAWSSMSESFWGTSNLEINATDAPDLSGVNSLFSMFAGAHVMNSDLNHWDVSGVNDMGSLFNGASAFNGDISSWDVSAVTNMYNMFFGALAFNRDISAWDVSGVTSMGNMFSVASAFNQDLGSWNVSGVTNMPGMFNDAISFNQNIGGWDVSAVTDMTRMFNGATVFNQNISGWDVSGVWSMFHMFDGAGSFNQNLGGWDVSNVTTMVNMLSNSGLSTENYDNTLIGWSGQTVQSSVELGATGLEYCNAGDERQILIDAPNNWTINDDGLAAGCPVQRPFITTWEVVAGDLDITIPTTGGGYNYDVDWGDGNSDTGVSGDITHTYGSAGTYTVEITGDFPRIYFDNTGDREKIMTVEQWGDVAWTSMENAFYGAANLEINATDAPDLSGVTSTVNMFNGASSMNSDLNHWDVSNVTDMSSMFVFASSFDGDISSWNTDNVTNMSGMFSAASAFNQDISTKTINAGTSDEYIAWDVSNVTEMEGMFLFTGASVFNRDISNWDVSGVTNMAGMFSGATAFNQDISGWDVSGVTHMHFMFDGAGSFDQDLGGWDVGNVTDMEQMLDNSGLSTTNYDNTLIGWSGQTVQSGVDLGADGLEYCNAETERQTLIDAPNNWTITGDALASGCSSTGFITTWKTDNPGTSNDDQITIPAVGASINYDVYWEDVTDATVNGTETTVLGDVTITFPAAGTYMIEITGNFPHIEFNNGGDKEKILTIEQWGDIEWSSFLLSFDGATNLEINATDAPDLSGVTSTFRMFANAVSLNSDLNHWDVSNITDMQTMFGGTSSFNGNISSWDVSNVTDMRFMFQQASAFNQDISGWNVGSVTNMGWMFSDAGAFNQDISGWDVSNVTDMERMFQNTSIFNQDISSWDVSGVTDMYEMFSGATAFNQDLGGWDVSSVTSMRNMLDNSDLSTTNYDNTLTGWAGQTVQSSVPLGAGGLEYCNAETERQTLIDAPNNWTITGDALAAGCGVSTGTDQRILASNQSTYLFSGGDFGLTDPAYSVKVETLPGIGDLQFDGSPVSTADIISVADINDDKLTWDQSTDTHGYNYTSFDFRVVDGGGTESDPPNTLSIDLGAASVELTGGEGWRFMTSPAIGETLGGFLNPVWSQGVAGSNDPGASFPNVYHIDQPTYVWDIPGNMSDPIGIGEAFITYIYSDDNSDGTPDGFPKTLMSGESWNPLDGTFEFTGLGYDTGQGPEGDSHYLIANPHPVSLDFCEMYDVSTNVASSVDIWDPAANGGNGDYINLNCAAPENVHLAPFQGFWVRTMDVNPELDVPEDAYLGSQAGGYFKQGRSAKSPKDFADLHGTEPSDRSKRSDGFIVELRLSGQNEVFTNTARILFSEQATTGLDKWDAPKLNPAGLANRWLSFYSLDEQNRAYAFQTIPDNFGEKITIPLNVETTEAGRYNLNWSLPEAQLFSGSYYLRDNVTGKVIELREGGRYSFEIEPDQTSKVSETLEVLGKERSAKSPTDFADLGEAAPRFELLIAQAGVDGMTELGAVPEQFTLAQNYPNPFNPTTVIRYQLPVNSEVSLEVYDMLGRRVAQLVNGQVAAGRHTVNFDASGLSSGIYLYRLVAGSQIMTRKLTVVK